MKTISIRQEPTELYKILKFEGLVSTGGEAKVVISGGLVKLNNVVETQKRKKIIAGNTIEFNNEKYLIKLES